MGAFPKMIPLVTLITLISHSIILLLNTILDIDGISQVKVVSVINSFEKVFFGF